MPRNLGPSRKLQGRVAIALIGVALLAYLIRRAGPSRIVEGIASVGWGLALVIALAGVTHLVRTWAWRLTLVGVPRRPAFRRMFALRLVSEASGQAGVLGQVFGDAWRIAKLGEETPLTSRIASVAVDRSLFTLSSTIVTIAGVASVPLLLQVSHRTAVYANIFAAVLIAIVFAAILAVKRRCGLLSGPAGALKRLGAIGRWLEGQRETIQSVEDRLLDFFHHSPAAFWQSFGLQIVGQATALLEVYLILRLMGCRAAVWSAVAIEGFTKLLNVIGLINPGNAGTYEGGNMLLAKLVGVGGTVGLTLGLIRRVRALVWAAVGAGCAVMLQGSARRNRPKNAITAPAAEHGHTALIVADGIPNDSLLARVGALPVLLRAILGAQKAGPGRIVVLMDPVAKLNVIEELQRTQRLPNTVEWREPIAREIASLLHEVEASQGRVVWIAADRIYHPSLHRKAAEWDGAKSLALISDGEPVGIYAATAAQSMRLLDGRTAGTPLIEVLENWAAAQRVVVWDPVASNYWQQVAFPDDYWLAEQKLDSWLVKSTDGVFARMNRKVSIPISRQLIRFRVTPNMVSFFILGVSLLAGVFFAFGSWAAMVAGAVLSVFASILDGCDGEVARLTFQESPFGSWLDSFCDSLYYIFLFGGMMIGLLRRGPIYMFWGGLLFLGALATILTTLAQRHRMAAARPEQYLSLWQAQASKRKSNPFLYLARHTEFLIRRCCLPYLVLAFAVFGGTYMAFIGAAVGSNIAWPIALYSYFTFDPARMSHE
jgi:phosphatidylglycerophosphate synthase